MSRTFRGIAVSLSAAVLVGAAAFAVQNTRPANRSTILIGDAAKPLFKQCSRSSPEGVDGYWKPSVADIRALDAAFPAFIASQKLPQGATAKNLNQYYFQCVGFTRKGLKLIYVNAFAPAIKDDMEHSVSNRRDWHKSAVVVCDGGYSFWGAEYDPATHRFTLLAFNGMA